MKPAILPSIVPVVLAACLSSLSAVAAPGWLEQKLLAPDGTAYDALGSSIAVDGDTAIISAPNNPAENGAGTYLGAAYVLRRIDGSWQIEQKLVASDGAPGDEFGTNVVLRGDVAFVAAPISNVGVQPPLLQAGAVYVFRYDGSSWNEVQKLTASDPAMVATFGDSVAFDGTTAIIGASGVRGPADEVFAGAAYVFTLSAGSFTQVQKLTSGRFLGARDLFGISAGVAGNVALIGASQAPWNDDGAGPGRVHVFEKGADGVWNQTDLLLASDAANNAFFGAALAFDGTTALIGSPGALIDGRIWQGAAYVYTRTDGIWSETKLVADPGLESAFFGRALALHQNQLVIGAPGVQVGDVAYAGAAYVFTATDGNWTQTAMLSASDGVAADYLGWAVGIGDNAVFAGAPHVLNDGLMMPGAVYAYAPAAADVVFADGFESSAGAVRAVPHVVTR